MWMSNKPVELPSAEQALPGRPDPMDVGDTHFVSGHRIRPPFPEGTAQAMFGMGCFWGAERRFWEAAGVYSTAVGYAAGLTPNPSYDEVCTGMTGHNEVVLVVYEPEHISYPSLLRIFWESHDPTQGMHQGNDVGTQYRSGIYVYSDAQRHEAESTLAEYQSALQARGKPAITTEILDAPPFYYAENFHQQYLAKNPNGYCGLGGTGIPLPGT